MPYVVAALVLGLSLLAGTPWLLAHCADRKARRHFDKMQRTRFRVR